MSEISGLRLYLISMSISSAYIVWGLTSSLMPLFYPIEADKKGATASQYGFVFGISNIAAFVFAPIFAQSETVIDPKNFYICGSFVQASASLAFGFLAEIKNENLFIGISYIIRAFRGTADVAIGTSILIILMKHFPSHLIRIAAFTEFIFGLGNIIGPAIGASLYSHGGFQPSFTLFGSLGILAALSLALVVPRVGSSDADVETQNTLTFKEIVQCPEMVVPFVDNFCCCCCNEMVVSMIGPFLTSSGESISDIGAFFVIKNGIYLIAVLITRWIVEKTNYPAILSIIGNVFLLLGFIFIGPLPSISTYSSYSSTIAAVASLALGYAMVVASTFNRAKKAMIKYGLKDDANLYVLISGMWSSSFFLGNFIGSTVGGFFVEASGFRHAVIPFVTMILAVILADGVEIKFSIRNRPIEEENIYQEFN